MSPNSFESTACLQFGNFRNRQSHNWHCSGYMASCGCFENTVAFILTCLLQLLLIKSIWLFPWMLSQHCVSHFELAFTFIWDVMNYLKAGVGQVHWGIYTRTCEHTHSHTYTHANVDISLSKIEKQIWNCGGDFCLVDFVFLFCQWTLNWCVTMSNFSFRNWRWRTREDTLLPILFFQITTELFWFGFVFREPTFVKNLFPYWSI